MIKIIEKHEPEGWVKFEENFDRHLFLAQPHGIINPALLDEDLKRAKEFSASCPDHWTYCTNTEDVRLVNPFNLLYLKEIKKLPKLREIVIFAPGSMNRFLLRVASPIVQPDRVIKDPTEFQAFLNSVQ